MTSKTKTGVDLCDLLEKIRSADIRQSKAQLEIANILVAIKDHELWVLEGHDSFAAMVTTELVFSVGTAAAYMSLHRSYTRLKYTEEEFLKLLQNFSWRKVGKAISHSKKKMGIRAINNYYASVEEQDNQFNFNLHNREVAEDFERILTEYGMEFHKGGMRTGMTTALLALLDDYTTLKGRSLNFAHRDQESSLKRSPASLH